MQKAMKFKTDSVIYFASDSPDRVYILQSGKVALNSIDSETNEPISRQIKPGELFGVKSVLGKYPRDETALVLSDAVVYAFNEADFEAFVVKNPRIILQMIKIYSKQLRTVHEQTKNLINKNSEKKEESSDIDELELSNDDGLYSVAEAFFKSDHFSVCAEVCRRYMKTYPSGKHLQEVKHLLANSQGKTGLGFGKGEVETNTVNIPAAYESLGQAQKLEDDAEYESAYKAYADFFDSSNILEAENALIGASRCLLKLEKYSEVIRLLSSGVKNNPQSPNISKMLFFIGKAYEKMGQADKAQAFYDKSEQFDLQVPEAEPDPREAAPSSESDSSSQFHRFAKIFKKGELIFAEYETGNTFYLIQSGQVQLIKAVNGYEKNLDILQPHEFFGEMAILDNSPRSASAIAYDEVKLLEFNKENFGLLIQGNPEIALVLLKTFVRRIYVQKRRYKVLTIQDKRVRLADVFLMLDETLSNLDKSSEMRIFEITLDDLARWASMTLPETEDNIAKFLDQGYIEVFPDRIVVQNISLLRRFVQSRNLRTNEQY